MNELTTASQNGIVQYTEEQVALLKRTLAKDATNDELSMFINQCKRTGLDAFTRQIYFIKNPKDGKVQIQTSVDGFRLVAERSGKYQGQTKPEWCGEDSVWKDVWVQKDLPMAARIGVYKSGFKEPLYAVALFDEYAQRKADGGLTYMWNKMPALMISKVAESLALRKAFPNDLSGLYTEDEMDQQHNEPETDSPKGHTVYPDQPGRDEGDGSHARPKPSANPSPIKPKVEPETFAEFKAPQPKPVFAEDKRKELGVIINQERVRLGWNAAKLGSFMMENMGKEGGSLSVDDMRLLIETLERMEPKV